MAAGRIKGITIEIGGDTTKLTKALASVDHAISTTQTNVRDLEKALKLDPGNAELLKDKQAELAKEIGNVKQKLELEKQALDQMKQSDGFDATSTQAQNLKTQIDLDTAALKDLEDQAKQSASVLGTQMQEAGKKISEVGEKVKGVGDKLSTLGGSMTAKVTTPIVGAFAASTKAAVDWESAFTGVMKTVDGTDDEYNQLANAIKQMATETASSKEDIAAVMEAAGQLGVSGVDNLINFTKTMVMLGDTTNLSANDAATSLARFMNITGESYTDSDKLGSSIVDLGNNFATSESEIVEMATRLASAGTIAGLSSTNILGLSAAMSSVGINAEAGGTAMAQTLTAIDKAVNGLDNGMEDIEKAQKKVTTASRAVEVAQDNLKKKQIAYNETVRKYSAADAKAQETAQKGVQTATTQLEAAQANAEKKQIAYNVAVEKYGQNSPQAQKALIDLETAQSKVAEKTSALTDAQSKLDNAMSGASLTNANVQKALIDLEAAERKLQDKTDDLTFAQDALASMTDGAGNKLELMAQVAGMSADEFSEKWKSSPIDAISAFITGLSSMDEESESTIAILDQLEMSGIRQSNMLKSLSLAADQLGGAIETSGEAYQNNQALEEEASKRYETMAAKMSQLKERFANVAVEIGERLMPHIEKLMGFLEGLVVKWDALDDSEKEQVLKIASIVAAIGPALLIIGEIVTGIGSVITAIGSISSAIGTVSTLIAGAGGIGSILTGVVGVLTGPVGIAVAVAAVAAAIFLNWDKIKEWTAELGEKISAFCEDVKAGWESWTSDVADKFSRFGEDVKAGWENLKADASAKWESIKSSVNEKVSSAVETVKSKWEAAKANTSAAWSTMKQLVNQNGGGIKGIINTASEGWKNLIKSAWDKANEKTGGAFGNMLTTVAEKSSSIRDTIEEKIGAAIDFIKDLPGKALQWGKDLIGNFIDGLKNPTLISDAMGSVAEKIRGFIHFSEPDVGPLKDFHTYAPDMIKLFTQGIERNLPMLEKASEKMAAVINPEITAAVQNGGGGAVTKNISAPINITVYGAQGQNVNQLAEIIQQKLNRAVINQEAVFA